MQKLSILFGTFLLLSSCEGFFDMEKEIDLVGSDTEGKIVVQGVIQPGYPAYVLLTKSEPYFSEVNNNTYENLFITDATVHVSNVAGELVELVNINDIPSFGFPQIDSTLEMIAQQYPGFYIEWPFDIQSFPPYHTIAEDGERFNLSIIHNNDTITSSTTIPTEHGMDSLWFAIDETAPRDSLGNFWFHYTDPDTLGNTIMFEHKRLAHTKEWTNPETGNIHVFQVSDQIFAKALWGFVRSDFEGLNGTAFDSYFQRGNVSNIVTDEWDDLIFEQEEHGYFKSGKSLNGHKQRVYPDTVLIRISQIDDAAFQFWRSVDYQSQATGNPFAEPINLQSNINGGYGIWCGQASFYYKAVAKEGETITERHHPFVDEIL